MSAVVDEQQTDPGRAVRADHWPAWAPPACALGAWLELQAGLVELGYEPACADDPERWWSNRPGDVENAKAVCAWCPLRQLCAAYALAADEPGGTWGGVSDQERRAITGRRR